MTIVTQLLDDLKVYKSARSVYSMRYHAIYQRMDHDCVLFIFP